MDRRLLFVVLGACGHVAAPTTPALGDHVTTIDGLATAYHVAGQGPPCIVVPGGPGLDWRYMKMPALERRLTLIYLEPLGTGGSAPLPKGESYIVARYARQLEGLRTALGMDSVCVIGHSHGGMIAEQYAITYPDHVATLVAYSAPSRGDQEFGAAFEAAVKSRADQPWFDGAMKAFAQDDEAKTDAEYTAAWRGELPFYFADFSPHADAYTAAAAVPAYVTPKLGMMPAGGKPTDFRPGFAKVRARTLVLVGAHDVCCGSRWGQEIASGIAGARIVELAHSGHMAHLEEPEAFATAVADFVLAGRPSR